MNFPLPVPCTDLSLLLFTILLLGNGFYSNFLFRSTAQLIPKDEVRALTRISEKLNINYWEDVSQTSCRDGGRTFNKTLAKNILTNVTCDCSFNSNTVCHVTNIQLKGLNLSGVIPPEFGNLTKLKELDLSRNYINGSIPTSLADTPLVILSLVVNRISGTIPVEIGKISTLEELVLEDNQLGGQLPESLGNLSKLRRLLLSANNFTGTIPTSFGKLKNLNDFRIDGSTLSGKLPVFIGNWTNLQKMYLQGTSMEGPIPSTISLMKNLTDLTISDLKGQSSEIPSQLQELTKLQRLALRNCLLNGTIPAFIGDMESLKLLDLSFNKLTGPIPNNFQKLDLNYMFLTNNYLTGSIPNWIRLSVDHVDVSYNDFSGSDSSRCQQTIVNVVSSYSSKAANSNSWCAKKGFPCPGKAQYHSMFINCGGTKMSYDGKEYEEDTTDLGPSYFSSKNNWAYSSTGVFLGNDKADYVATNTFGLNVTAPSYYQTARLSPLSLKYYGICLKRGSYKVQLHFAEIMYSDDKTFSSTGERIFDVSIQGKEVLKDFNIAKEAGGVGIGITKVYDNVDVNGSTLEIHLYWAGQGTTAVPDRGVYGPLISAITVTPNFPVGKGLPVGVIVGVSIATFVVLVMILVVLRLKGCLGGKVDEYNEFQGLDTGYFSLRQIKAATDDFNPGNKIGEGGFGPVYKGVLPDGKVIAVKQLSSKSKQGNKEFVNEIGMISALQHPNLVKLHGCCIEGKELLLVYEYMENNSLARALFGREDQRLKLKWATRKNICLGIARGLAYLHEESRLKIVHRDIKATNVLLDKDLSVKISDFGLAKLDEEENSHISTRVAGTIGYMAPEYAMRGYLTDKADVYSFGVVLLEIVSGKSNTNYRPREEFVYLLDWAYVLQEQGNLLELVDPSLGTHYTKDEAMRLLNLALLCTNPSPTLRPSMSSVVGMIEGTSPVQAPRVNLDGMRNDWRFRAFEISTSSADSRSHVEDSLQSYTPVVVRSTSVSTEGPWVDSSVCTKSKVEVEQESLNSSDRLLPGHNSDASVH